MNNLKPTILGSIAGAGIMFVALQYHVVQSHDGLQMVPRAPRAALGLAYADIREWKTEQYTDCPELARALVAHGASDLIANSVKREIADDLNGGGGTIGQLRSLLDDSLSSDIDAPLFGTDDGSGKTGDSPAIPFEWDAQRPDHSSPLADGSRDRGSRTHLADRTDRRRLNRDPFDEPFDGFDELEFDSNDNFDTDDTFAGNGRDSLGDPFADAEFFQEQEPRQSSPETAAEKRRRESARLEQLLFSDEEDAADSVRFETTSNFDAPAFDSITRELDSRAAQALDRAQQGFRSSIDTARRDTSSPGTETFRRQPRTTERGTVPRAIQALRDGADPFLD